MNDQAPKPLDPLRQALLLTDELIAVLDEVDYDNRGDGYDYEILGEMRMRLWLVLNEQERLRMERMHV